MQNIPADTRIAIHQGHDDVAPEPDWVGAVGDYWRDNDTLTLGEIKRMLADLDAEETGHEHRTGGGAAGCFTIRRAA